jgi:hypothetical protein
MVLNKKEFPAPRAGNSFLGGKVFFDIFGNKWLKFFGNPPDNGGNARQTIETLRAKRG